MLVANTKENNHPARAEDKVKLPSQPPKLQTGSSPSSANYFISVYVNADISVLCLSCCNLLPIRFFCFL